MIKKISKIKNLGIFSEYICPSCLPEFKRFNLVYGWNGSGKTTLSQLFASLETGKLETYPDFEYKIQTASGDITQDDAYKKHVRVFNRDYISGNIDISSGKAKPIFILGKESKELVEAVREDEKILNGNPEIKGDIGKIKELDLKKKELDRKDAEKGKAFSDVAKIISTNTSGVLARNYRKNNAEQAFLKLKTKQILTEEEIHKHSITLKQQEKTALTELTLEEIAKSVEEIIANAKSLLLSTVETAIIQRLKEHPDISEWVEQGITLHALKKSSNCEFCNQPLPPGRISELLAYFNDADKKLKDEIDILTTKIDQIRTTIEKLAIMDKANLYDELQPDYAISEAKFLKCKNDLLANIDQLKKEIEKKKSHTSVSLNLDTVVTTEPIAFAAKEVNSMIWKHNTKTKNFTQAKTDATNVLENHYLSEIFDNVKCIESDIKRIRLEISLLENGDNTDPAKPGVTQLQQRILKNRTKISSSGPACEEINNQLKTFLGRDELTFEVAEGGYLIKRKGKIAKNLSEGEKTAIAFVYFTIHLRDQDFLANEGVVVIDDPICSMDSNSSFQAFAFLKNAVSEASQIFILTHNFEFLKLLLNWLFNYQKKDGGKEFFMVKNYYENGIRKAKIDTLDPLLKEHESEYHYLFKLLYNFQSDGTIESVYHIPNIARKALEYFLLVMVPNSESMYKKLERLSFDKNKKTALYKFTNDQSHISGRNFDPSLVQESQNNVKHLLEMIKEVFPEHFAILVESMNAGAQGQP